MIDSDLTIRDISRYHDAYPNMKYYAYLHEVTDYPEDIFQISIGNNSICGIRRNMTTESTFPIRICCLCFGDNNRKERRIFRHGG